MSTETKVKTESVNVRGARYKERVSEFVTSRRGKMFGVAEVAALAGSCLILLLVMLSYLYFLVPARSRVASLEADRKQMQTNLQTLQGVVIKDQNTKEILCRKLRRVSTSSKLIFSCARIKAAWNCTTSSTS